MGYRHASNRVICPEKIAERLPVLNSLCNRTDLSFHHRRAGLPHFPCPVLTSGQENVPSALWRGAQSRAFRKPTDTGDAHVHAEEEDAN